MSTGSSCGSKAKLTAYALALALGILQSTARAQYSGSGGTGSGGGFSGSVSVNHKIQCMPDGGIKVTQCTKVPTQLNENCIEVSPQGIRCKQHTTYDYSVVATTTSNQCGFTYQGIDVSYDAAAAILGPNNIGVQGVLGGVGLSLVFIKDPVTGYSSPSNPIIHLYIVSTSNGQVVASTSLHKTIPVTTLVYNCTQVTTALTTSVNQGVTNLNNQLGRFNLKLEQFCTEGQNSGIGFTFCR